jgi:hypothetical protein
MRGVALIALLWLIAMLGSCATVNKLSEDLFSEGYPSQEEGAGKRIPLPPTIQDFESSAPDS